MSDEHIITDHSRGWRCSCGTWVHSTALDIRAATREAHLRWNGRGFVAEVKRYREEHGCTLPEAVRAVKFGEVPA